MQAAKFDKVRVPRWRRQVDVYASSDMEEDCSYAVISRSTDDTRGRSPLARLYFNRLGLGKEVQLLLSSKPRFLYIGPIPEA